MSVAPEITGFEMLEKLGQGGMATVWKARQLSLDRIVAIKILSAQFASDTEDIQMFQKEAQSAAKLKHQGIVQVYDANAENGMYFFIMEYVAGYTVGDWIRRKGVLTEKDALLVGECVADALEYAWDREQIIHCDIKPDNVIIDADGTVKLADLGLARTLSAMSAEEAIEDVMGTPAYISPEQAMADPDLDFRADMYSLGAMFYHLVTGQLLFEGYQDGDVMEMQVNDTVVDPIDINPQLSKPVCWLIEKLLCKEAEGRQASWKVVRDDIARAKKGLMPGGEPPISGASTVERSRRRTKQDYTRATKVAKKQASSGAKAYIIAGAVVLALIVAGSIIALSRKPQPAPARPRSGQGGQRRPSGPASVDKDKAAKAMYDFARKWASDHPLEYNNAIQRITKVADETKGTKYSLMAEDDVIRLTGMRDAKVVDIMAKLRREAEYFVESGEFDYAADIFASYKEACQAETRPARIVAAKEILKLKARRKTEAEEKKQAIATKTEALYAGVAEKLTVGGVSLAQDFMSEALADDDLDEVKDRFAGLQKLLDDAASVDSTIMDSFKAEIGKTITVHLSNGKTTLMVKRVNRGLVTGEARMHGAVIARSFRYEDLDVRERLVRMGHDDQPEVALVKGLMALISGAYEHARRYFEKTDKSISERLINLVKQLESRGISDNSRSALDSLVRLAGVMNPPGDSSALAAAVSSKKNVSAIAVLRIQASVKDYRATYGDTETARDCEAVLAALEGLEPAPSTARVSPAVRVPVVLSRELAAIKGDGDAVARLLYERNEGIPEGGIRLRKDASGTIAEIYVTSHHLQDISPLAALRDLKSFRFANNSSIGSNLKDIRPLRGLPLEMLHIARCRVSDVSALSYMPLKRVGLVGTSVKSIRSLRGMQLERLSLSGSPVLDYSPISGQPITHLELNGCPIRSILFLKTMPLVHLELGATKLRDYSVLSRLKLTHLSLREASISDIGFTRNMALNHLDVSHTGVRDFSLIRQMPLTSFAASHTAFRNTEFLEGKKLTSLDLGHTKISSVAALRGMQIIELDISHTGVSDLSPLGGMPITQLNCAGTRVSDVSVLVSMPLKYLIIDGASISGTMIGLLYKQGLRSVNGYSIAYYGLAGVISKIKG